MSLFGGDSAPVSAVSSPPSSDFSISPIPLSDPIVIDPPDSQYAQQDIPYAEVEDDADFILPEQIAAEDPGSDYEDHDHQLHATLGDDDRPNRFTGTERAWRHYTENERGLAASLDQLRASNLSLHLYNAHALKARLRRPDAGRDTKAWERKSTWIKCEEDGERSKPWYPENQWTAWPLEPESVPRNETFTSGYRNGVGLERYTVRKTESHKLSRDLEEQLLAVALRRAKEMWNERPDEENDKAGIPVTRSPSATRSEAGRSTSRARSRSASAAPRRSVSRGASEAPSESGDRADADGDVAMKEEANEEAGNAEPEAYFRPVFSADEERSHKLLQPTVRHVLSKLDSLLMALHHNRQGHYKSAQTMTGRARGRPGSRSQSVASQARRGSSIRSRGKTSRTPGPSTDNVDGEDTEVDEERPTKRRRGSTQSIESDGASSVRSGTPGEDGDRTGLRDWSEVLGLAAMTGWKPSVIKRATQRCSALFNERMDFRVLPENPSTVSSRAPRPVQYPLEPIPASDTIPDSEAAIIEGYLCPHPHCPRHTQPFPPSKGYRFREHLRKSHKYTNEQIAELESGLSARSTVTGGRSSQGRGANPRNWVPPDPLVCPHATTCRSKDKVFGAPHRLVEHLKRTHGYDPRVEEAPAGGGAESRRQSDDEGEGDDEDEMVGGVHNDGFMQPIKAFKVRGKDAGKRGREKTDELSQREERTDELSQREERARRREGKRVKTGNVESALES